MGDEILPTKSRSKLVSMTLILSPSREGDIVSFSGKISSKSSIVESGEPIHVGEDDWGTGEEAGIGDGERHVEDVGSGEYEKGPDSIAWLIR